VTKFDISCGTLALLALVFWIITRNFSISILFAILSDGLASIPTVFKSWKFPETETPSAYIGGIIANTLGLLIITNWTFPIYSLGVYFVLINIVIVFCLYHKKIFRRRVSF
jgi:hypothetical protein